MFPMLALCAPAVRALAMRARAVRLRVVCGVLVHAALAYIFCIHRAALVDVADTTSFEDPGDPSEDLTHALPHSQSH